ncbi:MAG: hypothetical protein D8M58_05235 [Calditrichaeota bacterium]|nr:MAG: hypothetical protein DWQ03_21270 [Calditrichota bacterium]MBL1204778.1 hypothetical protein [Calditrichota bacterium]NOG44607.1 hypothetical protein [Calditrichota bacterium]
MKTITIRGVDPTLADALQKKAFQEKESINKTILKIMRKELGLLQDSFYKRHHDLDHLAGTWNAEDAKEFDKNIEPFNKIDAEIWK